MSVAESSAADEIERRREDEYETPATSGLRRLDREDAEAALERAMGTARSEGRLVQGSRFENWPIDRDGWWTLRMYGLNLFFFYYYFFFFIYLFIITHQS